MCEELVADLLIAGFVNLPPTLDLLAQNSKIACAEFVAVFDIGSGFLACEPAPTFTIRQRNPRKCRNVLQCSRHKPVDIVLGILIEDATQRYEGR